MAEIRVAIDRDSFLVTHETIFCRIRPDEKSLLKQGSQNAARQVLSDRRPGLSCRKKP